MAGTMPAALAGLGGIAHQIGEDLPQQHLVAVDLAERSRDLERRARGQLAQQLLGRTTRQRLEPDRRERHRVRAREVQEVRHNLSERLGLLPDALDVRTVLRRERIRHQQAAVAVNRREAVPEFVGNPGGELARRAPAPP